MYSGTETPEVGNFVRIRGSKQVYLVYGITPYTNLYQCTKVDPDGPGNLTAETIEVPLPQIQLAYPPFIKIGAAVQIKIPQEKLLHQRELQTSYIHGPNVCGRYLNLLTVKDNPYDLIDSAHEPHNKFHHWCHLMPVTVETPYALPTSIVQDASPKTVSPQEFRALKILSQTLSELLRQIEANNSV